MTSLPEAKARLKTSIRTHYSAAVFDDPIACPQLQIDADGKILAACIASGNTAPHVRVWENTSCLVVPHRIAKNPHFQRAKTDCSLPVAFRRSGGSAVLHGPDFLNITVAQKLSHVSLTAAYDPLIGVLLPMLADYGIKADTGQVSDAHCNGVFNIRHKGRKLAGTSARVLKRSGGHYTVAHATIQLRFTGNHLNTIKAFERALGLDQKYELIAHTAVLSIDTLATRQCQFNP